MNELPVFGSSGARPRIPFNWYIPASYVILKNSKFEIHIVPFVRHTISSTNVPFSYTLP